MYHLPQLYDDMHRSVTEDLGYYVQLAGSLAGRARVLELGCGTGRIARALAGAGHEVVGLDTSEEMLGYAAQRLDGVRFVKGDMRRFSLNERFDLIILGLNGVGHLDGDSELAGMFSCVAEHLAGGGRFALHLFTEGSGVAPDGEGIVYRGSVRAYGKEYSWYESRSLCTIDSGAGPIRRENITWYFFCNGPDCDDSDAEPIVATLDLTIHRPERVRAVAAGAGLSLVSESSDFDAGAPADGDSPNWVGVWRRAVKRR